MNPSASAVTARARVVIRKALAADHEVEVAETSRRGHATRLAQGAAAAGTDVVVVLGGDGTLNEAANGLAGSDTAMAALPGGSTNVFARTLRLPNEPIEATAVVLEALEQGAISRMGLGSVNGRYFLFHTGIGFDAAVVSQVERRSGLKRYAGHPLYLYATLSTWQRHYDRSRPRFAVHLPGGTVVDDAYFAVCLNTDPYTYMGKRPLRLAPDDATFDKGLAMLSLRSLSLSTILAVTTSALGTGRRARRHRLTDYRSDLASVRVRGHGPFPYQVDGDYLGEVDELVFRHQPDALRLVTPVASS
ncbi:MAG TPA: diacylglycerol kinase family protein [Acidimicrobiales bacterium]|nr:diacylglycerol kinase family protein [Acidimicrobiales bacterium]